MKISILSIFIGSAAFSSVNLCLETYQNRNTNRTFDLKVANRENLKSNLGSAVRTQRIKDLIRQFQDQGMTKKEGLYFLYSNIENYKLGKIRLFETTENALREAINRIEAIESNYIDLLFDLSIISRFEEFINFAKKLKNNGQLPTDPWMVRELFSKELKHRIVSRAMTITKEEFNFLSQNGIRPLNLSQIDIINDQFHYPEELLSHIKQVLVGKTRKPFTFMSVTEHPLIGALVSFKTHKYENMLTQLTFQKESPTKITVVFNLEIPTLDIIEFSDKSDPLLLRLLGTNPIARTKTILHFSDKKDQVFPYSSAVESFVMFEVMKDEILSSKVIPEAILENTFLEMN